MDPTQSTQPGQSGQSATPTQSQQTQQTPTTEAGAQATPSQQQQVPVDVIRTIATEMAAANQKTQQQAPRQMTDDEIRQKFNFYKPSPTVLEAFGEHGQAIVGELQEGMAKQAFAMAQYMTQQQAQAVAAELQALKQQQQEVVLAQKRERFYASNPDLAANRKVTEMVANHILQDPQINYMTEEQVINLIATEARKYIPAQQQQNQNTGQPRSTLYGGGQAGVGQARPETQQGPPSGVSLAKGLFG